MKDHRQIDSVEADQYSVIVLLQRNYHQIEFKSTLFSHLGSFFAAICNFSTKFGIPEIGTEMN